MKGRRMKDLDDKLVDQTRRDVERLERHEREPATLVGLLVYGGTVGLLFIVPTVLGAYLGRWLDSIARGYSVRWTVSCIVLGIAIGGYNAWRFLKDRL
jgi:ATP synthase protein I